MNENFIVLIINKRFTRWEIIDSLSTIGYIFETLKNKYNINNCIIEINKIIYMNKKKNNDILLSDIILQTNIRTFFVTTKEKIFYLEKEK